MLLKLFYNYLYLQKLWLQGCNRLCIYQLPMQLVGCFYKGSAVPLKHPVRNCFVTSCMGSFSTYQVSDKVLVPFTAYITNFIANTIHAQILGKFVVLLPWSKGVKDIGYILAYW